MIFIVLRNIRKRLLIWLVILIASTLSLTLVTGKYIDDIQNLKQTEELLSFKYIGTSTMNLSDTNSVEYLNRNVTFYNEVNETGTVLSESINSIVFRLENNVTETEDFIVNSSNTIKGSLENITGNNIGISKKIADQYKLSLGDILYHKDGILVKSYTIELIFNHDTGILNEPIHTEIGNIIVSSDFNYESEERTYLHFFNQSNLIYNNIIKNSERYSVLDDELNQIKQLTLYIASVIFILVYLLDYLLFKSPYQYLEKKLLKRDVNTFKLLELFLFLGIGIITIFIITNVTLHLDKESIMILIFSMITGGYFVARNTILDIRS